MAEKCSPSWALTLRYIATKAGLPLYGNHRSAREFFMAGGDTTVTGMPWKLCANRRKLRSKLATSSASVADA